MIKAGIKLAAVGAMALALVTNSAHAALGDIDTFFLAVFDDPGVTFDCGGGFCFQTPGDAEQAGTTVSGDSVSLGPNYTFYAAGDPFWDNNGQGNKQVTASSFGEVVGVAVGTGTVTIEGCIDAYTLDSGYSVQAFIKLLDPNAGYNDIVGARETISGAGAFSLSEDLTAYEGDTELIAQTGFEVVGLNGNPADKEALGSVSLTINGTCSSTGPGLSDPNAIPVMSLWSLLALMGLLGWFGSRSLVRRRQ